MTIPVRDFKDVNNEDLLEVFERSIKFIATKKHNFMGQCRELSEIEQENDINIYNNTKKEIERRLSING